MLARRIVRRRRAPFCWGNAVARGFAAEKTAPLVDVHLETTFDQLMGGAQTCNATSDDRHLLAHAQMPPRPDGPSRRTLLFWETRAEPPIQTSAQPSSHFAPRWRPARACRVALARRELTYLQITATVVERCATSC